LPHSTDKFWHNLQLGSIKATTQTDSVSFSTVDLNVATSRRLNFSQPPKFLAVAEVELGLAAGTVVVVVVVGL